MDALQEKTGLSKGYLSKLENGKRDIPKPETIKKLAKGLDAPYIELLHKAGYIDTQELEHIEKNELELDVAANWLKNKALGHDQEHDLFNIIRFNKKLHLNGDILDDTERRRYIKLIQKEREGND